MNLSEAIIEVGEEYHRAAKKFPPFRSAHEGIAIIEEEYLEFRETIFKDKSYADSIIKRMRQKEATQLAAMAIRFLVDLC